MAEASRGKGSERSSTTTGRYGLVASWVRRSRLRRLNAIRQKRPAEPDRPRRDDRIWQSPALRRMIQGLAAGVVVVILGVLGYVALGWGWFDAFYMVVITVSGVGFGEVRAIRSTAERIHTMLVIVFGMAVVGHTLGRFIQLLTEGEIQNLVGHRRMRMEIGMLEGHTVVAGFGRVGALVCEELFDAEMPFVVIERTPEKVPELEGKGYLYVSGDATEENVLRDAGLERAKVLVTAMPNDAANVFITLTARQMAHDVMIVARAEQTSTSKKLRQAGANHVILPALIGAHRIVSLLTNPTAVEFAELVTQRSSLAIEMDELPIRETSPLKGLTLRDADIARRTGTIVIAVKCADGRVEFPPPADVPLTQGDSIVVLGKRSNLDQFRTLFGF